MPATSNNDDMHEQFNIFFSGQAYAISNQNGGLGMWQQDDHAQGPLFFKGEETARAYCDRIALGYSPLQIAAEDALANDVFYVVDDLAFPKNGGVEQTIVCFDKSEEKAGLRWWLAINGRSGDLSTVVDYSGAALPAGRIEEENRGRRSQMYSPRQAGEAGEGDEMDRIPNGQQVVSIRKL